MAIGALNAGEFAAYGNAGNAVDLTATGRDDCLGVDGAVFTTSELTFLAASVSAIKAMWRRALTKVAHTAAPQSPRSEKSEIRGALAACRGALIGIGMLTVVINVLTLTGSLFMLEVYDRVLPGRSVPTLVGLAILTGVLLAIQGILDLIRSRVLVRIGAYIDTD